MAIEHKIHAKTNRVLNLIALSMILILIRVWYLSIVQHDEYVQIARRPQRRTVIEHVERATIRDRFNIPLAINKIQYNAAVCYADIRQVPSVVWKKDATGKSQRFQARAAYVKELSLVLANELGLDPLAVEDIIHGKASLFPHTPFVVKEDLSEEQYYRLRLLEKDWLGIETKRSSKRIYPQGKCAADIVGYMGAISQKEYFNIAQEIKELKGYIEEREAGELPVLPKGFENPLEVRQRLKALQEKSYTINDLVGKAGIEAVFDENLRGYYGRKTYEINTKGNFLREFPGARQAVPGQRILLSISSELQEYAEQLLAQNEKFRESKTHDGSINLSRPWIKGGAIVAIHPQTGEVLALASYPRLDPNDFIPVNDPETKKKRQSNILRWLENETYVGQIWDGRRPLEREIFSLKDNAFLEENLPLTWEKYLQIILPPNSSIHQAMLNIDDIQKAYRLQKEIDSLVNISSQNEIRTLINALYPTEEGNLTSRQKVPAELKNQIMAKLREQNTAASNAMEYLNRYLKPIRHNDDKLLVIDLCRMLVNTEIFSDNLLQALGKESIAAFRAHTQAAATVQSALREFAQEWFHSIDFKKWREENFKDFLKQKRKEEKEKKRYTRPYTEYLELLEKTMFKDFWLQNRDHFVLAFLLNDKQIEENASSSLHPYFECILESRSKTLEKSPEVENLRARLASIPTPLALSYLKSMRSFEELNRPLIGRYRSLRNTSGVQMEKHLAAAFYPLTGYGYGRSQAYRQSSPQGSVFKVIVSYQSLMERYQWLLENGRNIYDLNPLTLVDDVKWDKAGSNHQVLGFTLEGKAITRLYKGGRLPRSHPNIGKIDLTGALEQSSNLYFAMLASDHIQDPGNLVQAAKNLGFGEKTGIDLPGEIAGNIPDDVVHNRTGLYSFAIGQHSLVVTPLQTALMIGAIATSGKVLKPKIVQLIAGKEPVREKQNLFAHTEFPYQDTLALIGISFPLFTSTLKDPGLAMVTQIPTEVRRILPLPDEARNLILEGMRRVVNGTRGTARPNIIRSFYENPKAMRDYFDLKNQIVGKTGTAEILYKQTIDAESLAEIVNHIWFVGISFASSPDPTKGKDTWGEPELVFAVYLRFSDSGGKEAAPLAAQMVKKWREICAKHGRSAHILPIPN